MFCQKCGYSIPDGENVCPNCGTQSVNVKFCQYCGDPISLDATICPKCGKAVGFNPSTEPNAAPEQTARHSKAWKIFSWIGCVLGLMFTIAYIPSISGILFLLFTLIVIPLDFVQRIWKSVRIQRAIKGILLLVLFFSAVAFAPTEESPANDGQSASGDMQDTSINENKQGKNLDSEKPIANTDFDTTGYMKIDADVLFEYKGYLGNQKIVTVITAADVDARSGSVKAKTSNNDSYFFSIICEFSDKTTLDSVNDGMALTIAGTVEGSGSIAETVAFLDTPTASIEDCVIIGLGEIAQELKDSSSEQIQMCEDAKYAYEKQIESAKKEERDSYIDQCESVKYSDVERNPDNYDGKKVKITGKVIQVSEGWFDSVTLRIDCNGNIWLVSYYREEGESRILENDKITCYGECTGVKSYTTVLGSSVTIPSMDMEYYD